MTQPIQLSQEPEQTASSAGVLRGLLQLRLSRSWILVTLSVIAVHAATLTISPTIWQDEVQIIDFGRSVVFEPSSDWSINWLEEGREVPLVGVLGPLVQEVSLRAVGSTPVGPRLSALLGACLAATLLVAWLYERGLRRKWWVLALGVCFLLEPGFVSGYRGARVDSWAFAAIFGACWCLRLAFRERPLLFAGLAGVLGVIACFFWPAAVFSLPILPIEYWLAIRSRNGPFAARDARAIVYGFVAGGAVTTLAGIAAVFALQPEMREVFAFMARTQFDEPPASALDTLRAFVNGIKLNPLFWLTTGLAAFAAPLIALVPLVFGWIATFATTMYVHRIIYILPAALLVLAEALGGDGRLSKRVKIGAVLTVAWCIGLSLGVRSVLAVGGASARDPQLISDFAREAIGPGSHRVYVEPWEFYYAGRELRWEMFRPYPGRSDDNRRLLASTTDYTVVPIEQIPKVQGWGLNLELAAVSPEVPKTELGGARYGRYAVFRRQQ